MHSNRRYFDAFGVTIIPWYVSVGGRAVHPVLFYSFVLELTHRLDMVSIIVGGWAVHFFLSLVRNAAIPGF
jgi:uncharacterized membrane protein YeiH